MMLATEPKTTAQLLAELDGLFASIPDDGELTPEWELELQQWVEGAENKADGLRLAHSKINHDLDFIEKETERLKKRFSSLVKSKEQVKYLAGNLLHAHEEATGERKIKGKLGTVYFQSTTAVHLTVTPEELPEAYRRIQQPQVQADKEKIKEALSNGESVVGAKLVKTDGVRFR